MPKKALPAQIHRNDRQPNTEAQADGIEAIQQHYADVDHLTEIADRTDYSASHINNCYRKFFDASTNVSKTEAKKRSSPKIDSDELMIETPAGTFRVKSDDPEIRKEFLRSVTEAVA